MNTVLAEQTTPLRQQAASLAGRAWLPIAIGCCFLYGLLLVALIHTTADGSWYWYSNALRNGQHLYRDLHLPLQPLYPVELASLQRLFGTSWLAQQAIGIVNLVLFLCALTLIVVRAALATWQRALLFCCAFVTCMAFIMMRFDDFHIVAATLDLGCAALLLRLPQASSERERVAFYAGLGVLCGACMLVRINDGSLLLCAVLVIACFSAKSRAGAITAMLTIPCVAGLLGLLVIASIGESPRDWWLYSIRGAAAIKGGSGQLLFYPLRLPLGTVREFTRDWRSLALITYVLAIGAVAWTLASGRLRTIRARRAMLIAIVLPAVPLGRNIIRGNAARVLVALAVLAIYVAACVVLVRLFHALRGRAAASWRPTELVVLIPAASLVAIALSAAHWYPNTNPSAALLIVLLPVALPWLFRSRPARAVFLSWVALLTLSAGVDKLRNPFEWFNYRAGSVSASRVWMHHPAFGPMLVETQQLKLVQPVCNAISTTPPQQRQLLSLPFTYANYFCNIPPWHGYVQTFYDLSSRQTIQTLQDELQQDPPEWIVYQRQLDVLSRNEEAFNQSRPLPHRDLDRFILAKLNGGQWSATVLPKQDVDTSTWLLIRTHPKDALRF